MRCLSEAYHPGTLISVPDAVLNDFVRRTKEDYALTLPLAEFMTAKARPVFILRVGKAFAIPLNAIVGRLFLGWEKGESRILDLVGDGTERLYSKRESVDIPLICPRINLNDF
jgi:hypothetical protein